jgi:hypothetical protein
MKLYHATTAQLARDLPFEGFHHAPPPSHPGHPKRGVWFTADLPVFDQNVPQQCSVIFEVDFPGEQGRWEPWLWDKDDEGSGYFMPAHLANSFGIKRRLLPQELAKAATKEMASHRRALRKAGAKRQEIADYLASLESRLQRWMDPEA